MFLVFEGTDGSGSSTQAKMLAVSLQKKGLSVLHTAEPSENFLGKLLRKCLQHEEKISSKAFQLLFFADRQEHLENEIFPALAAGKIVICERYVWSSIAYGTASGVEKKFLENLANTFPKPDYTFFLDLPPEISMERIVERGQKQEFFEEKNMLKNVRNEMLDLAERCAFTKKATVLDAKESREQIFSRIEMVLTPLLFAKNFEPLGIFPA